MCGPFRHYSLFCFGTKTVSLSNVEAVQTHANYDGTVNWWREHAHIEHCQEFVTQAICLCVLRLNREPVLWPVQFTHMIFQLRKKKNNNTEKIKHQNFNILNLLSCVLQPNAHKSTSKWAHFNVNRQQVAKSRHKWLTKTNYNYNMCKIGTIQPRERERQTKNCHTIVDIFFSATRFVWAPFVLAFHSTNMETNKFI